MNNENKKAPKHLTLEQYEKIELLKEIEWLRKIKQEQEEVINQLFFDATGHGKIVEYQYIHPFDLAELIDKAHTITDIIELSKSLDGYNSDFVTLDGIKYKQSVCIPALTNKYQ